MTVGISLTNGKEAVLLADSCETSAGRLSNSTNKLHTFEGETYVGALMGAGSGHYIETLTSQLAGLRQERLEDTVHCMSDKLKAKYDYNKQRGIENQRREIALKASLIADEEKRKQFTDQEIARAFGQYEKGWEDQNVGFLVVGYDKTTDGVRQFLFDHNGYEEHHNIHAYIGSGMEGAHRYFYEKLQGIPHNAMKPDELLFFALNAYMHATINQGVGGAPKIALVSQEGVQIVPYRTTCALANVTAAYAAEYSDELTRQKTEDLLKQIHRDEKFDFRQIERYVGLNADALSTMVIPYSIWQERANAIRFNGGREHE